MVRERRQVQWHVCSLSEKKNTCESEEEMERVFSSFFENVRSLCIDEGKKTVSLFFSFFCRCRRSFLSLSLFSLSSEDRKRHDEFSPGTSSRQETASHVSSFSCCSYCLLRPRYFCRWFFFIWPPPPTSPTSIFPFPSHFVLLLLLLHNRTHGDGRTHGSSRHGPRRHGRCERGMVHGAFDDVARARPFA